MLQKAQYSAPSWMTGVRQSARPVQMLLTRVLPFLQTQMPLTGWLSKSVVLQARQLSSGSVTGSTQPVIVVHMPFTSSPRMQPQFKLLLTSSSPEGQSVQIDEVHSRHRG